MRQRADTTVKLGLVILNVSALKNVDSFAAYEKLVLSTIMMSTVNVIILKIMIYSVCCFWIRASNCDESPLIDARTAVSLSSLSPTRMNYVKLTKF